MIFGLMNFTNSIKVFLNMREIAIISGKGGTGKSTISAAFASLSNRIVLADCDVDAANLYILFRPKVTEEEIFVSGQVAIINKEKCTNCGICLEYCRFDAIFDIDGEIIISDIACDGCELCKRVCPEDSISMVQEDDSRLYVGNFGKGKIVYGRLAPGEENSGRLVDYVRDKAKAIVRAESIDTILIDGPPGIGCPVISAITGVDRVVVVTEPTISGMHDLERTLEVCRNFKVSTQLIINKSDLNEEVTLAIEKYCHKEGVEVIGKIPFDPKMVEAMVHCQSIIDYAPTSSTSKILKQAYRAVFQP